MSMSNQSSICQYIRHKDSNHKRSICQKPADHYSNEFQMYLCEKHLIKQIQQIHNNKEDDKDEVNSYGNNKKRKQSHPDNVYSDKSEYYEQSNKLSNTNENNGLYSTRYENIMKDIQTQIKKCVDNRKGCENEIANISVQITNSINDKVFRNYLVKEKLFLREKEAELSKREEKLMNKELHLKMKIEAEWEEDPRSLFGPLNTPIPPIKPVVPINNDNTFLDRKEELKLIWNIMIHNWTFRNSDQIKQQLIVTGQMFGIGKTTLGQNILNFDVLHIAEEFNKLPDSEGKNALRNARYFLIDLHKNKPIDGIEDIEGWISYLIWVKVFKKLFGISNNKSEKFWMIHKYRIEKCLAELQSLCNCSFYIHFDEICALENSKFCLKSNIPAEDYQNRLLIYYQFLEELIPLFIEGVFIYCTGKSSILSDVGLKKLGNHISPFTSTHIYLSSFSVIDIIDALRASKSVAKCVDDTKIHAVAKWLHDWTAGIPRFIYYGIDGIIKAFNTNKLTKRSMLKEQPYQSIIIDTMLNAPGAKPNFSIDIEEPPGSKIRNILRAVLFAAACGFIFKKDDYIPGIQEFKVMDLVDRFNLYTSKDILISGSTLYGIKILIPRLWREGIDTKDFPELALFKTTDLSIVNKGLALEIILEKMIVSRCNYHCENIFIEQVLPFLLNKETCVKNFRMIEPLKQTYLDMKVLVNTTTEEIKNKLLNSGNGLNNLLLTFLPKSSTVDLSILLDNKIIGFQCKNVETNFNVNILNSEISKFKRLAEVVKIEDSPVRYALFILVLTGKGTKEIEILRGKVFDSETISSYTTKIKIVIPEKMQFLILTESDLIDLIGEINLKDLRLIGKTSNTSLML